MAGVSALRPVNTPAETIAVALTNACYNPRRLLNIKAYAGKQDVRLIRDKTCTGVRYHPLVRSAGGGAGQLQAGAGGACAFM
jgi:hypothetical protein